MAVGDAYVFPGFLTPVLTQLVFPKPPTTFLTCFCRVKRRKNAGKKSRFNRESISQPPGHESDTLTTEPPGWGLKGFADDKTDIAQITVLDLDEIQNIVGKGENADYQHFLSFLQCFQMPSSSVKVVIIYIYILLFPKSLINTLPDDKILGYSKLKGFAVEKRDIAQITILVLDGGRKHYGNRRKCRLPAFLPFLTTFSDTFFFRVVKTRDCMEKS